MDIQQETDINTNSQSLYHPVDIGSVKISGNLFLAPVAGYSDAAFRAICRDCGASLCYTEMVSSEALTRGSDKTHDIMLRAPNEDIYAVQLFGGVAETMADATKIVIERCNPEIIDINAGCPVPKIIKSGAGSSLTKDPELLYKITKATVEAAGKTPVTVKIRSGWDNSHITFREAGLAAFEAGAKAVTLHGRTKVQCYEGKANWAYLKELVEMIAEVSGFNYDVKFITDDYVNNQVINEISHYLKHHKVYPKVYISYSRKAFFAKNDRNFRVTFDSNIIARRDTLSLQDGSFGYPILDEAYYLMEVKILGSIPLWFTNILSQLRIYNTHYSKYGNEFMGYCLNKNYAYNKRGEKVC